MPHPRIVEKAFVVFVLVASLGAFANLTVNGAPRSDNTGMLGMQVMWAVLYFITIMLFYRSSGRPLMSIAEVFPVIAVIAFAFISALWSQDPGITLRRSAALALCLVFGVYFSSRFSLKEQFQLLAAAFAVCIIFSFFFELSGLNPDQGIPGWYGVFYVKVDLGRNMALAALTFLFWKKVEPARRSWALAGFFASAMLVVLARDVTSLLILVLLLALLPYLQWTLRKTLGWALAGTAFLLASGTLLVSYVALNLTEITTLLGKDPMLTGRVPLWILSVVMALRRPWLGYGFNAFWLPDEPYVQKIWGLLRWMPPHAHNGILELWLELGIVGTGLFLLGFAYYLIKALSFLRHNSGPDSAWPLIYLLFLFLANLTESAFLTTNSIYFFLFVGVAVMCTQKSEAGEANPLRTFRQRYA